MARCISGDSVSPSCTAIWLATIRQVLSKDSKIPTTPAYGFAKAPFAISPREEFKFIPSIERGVLQNLHHESVDGGHIIHEGVTDRKPFGKSVRAPVAFLNFVVERN
jgi:hypothetical protein